MNRRRKFIEKVAVIGMGVSGSATLLAYQKAKQKYPNMEVEIDCFDTEASFGRGVPFREPSEEALINSPSDAISYDFENMHDFVEWLEEKQIPIPQYAPRRLYGDYLFDRTQELVEALNATSFYSKVESLTWLPTKKKWAVKLEKSELASDEDLLYDRVHLCCGEFPVQDFYQLKGHPRYIHQTYPLNKYPKAVDTSAKVGIIGTGLSGIDVLKYLGNDRQVAEIFIFSLGGHFPTVRGNDEVEIQFECLQQEWVDAQIKLNNGYLDFETVDKWITHDLASNQLDFEAFKEEYYLPGIEGIEKTLANPEIVGQMQVAMSHLTVIMTAIWEVLSEENRKQFNEKYNDIINHLRNPMPPDSAKEILALAKENRLTVLGDLDTIDREADDKLILIPEDKEEKSVAVDWVVNATGGQLTNKSELDNHPLLDHLLDERIAQVDTAKGLSMNRQTVQVISPRYGEWDNLHAHGMLVNGVIYQNNSTIKIQQHAEALINRLLEKKQ